MFFLKEVMATNEKKPVYRSAGYLALIERYQLAVIPNWHQSRVVNKNTAKTYEERGIIVDVYPERYWSGDGVGDQLEFALKYDGVNLAILARLFEVIDVQELLTYIQSKPTGKYARKIWYLYEFLTGKKLPLDDVKQGNYVDLLEEEKYYTAPRCPIRRQRINDNLLGNRHFCPIVRRTDTLHQFEGRNFSARCQQIIDGYPDALLKRAVGFLYTKETRSSFEIERVKLSPQRVQRFVELLQFAAEEDFFNKDALINLQNHIVVDERFHNKDYRTNQNYVGENHALHGALIHFISPKPEDLPDLMQGLLEAHQRMEAGNVSPVVHAATIAYGFVFMHPFEDGNGRIHRFLIHNILARKGFTPEGVIFPVSAVMLRNMKAYDASLEAFSKPLVRLIEYDLDEDGILTVRNKTALWYRYMDMTPQVEALFRFIEMTLEQELTQEFTYLERYDKAQRAVRAIVPDMPDNKVNLFIKLCLQNNGKLSAKKRKKFFAQLTDEEITKMEMAIKEALDNGKDINPAPKL